jgi:hypothetical protein
MAALTGNKIKDSYLGLLKTTNSGILTSSFVRITDGGGNNTQLYLSNTAIRFYDAYTFPSADGTVSGQVLTTDANGALSWADSSDNQTLDEVLTQGNTATLAILSTADGNTFGSTTFDDAVTGTTANFTTSVTSPDFIGDLNGSVRFVAKMIGSSVLKGQVVYVSGLSGNTPEVQLAKANSTTTMTAVGIAADDANQNASFEVDTLGSARGIDLSDCIETGITLTEGDVLYVSATEAGHLTNVAPTGVANLIQNIGMAIRVDPTTNATIKVMGAGRANALPNLPTGVIVGNGTSTVSASSNLLIASDGTITLYQPNNVPTDIKNYNIGGGNIALNTDGFNTGFGEGNLSQVGFVGSNNSAFGYQSSFAMTTGDNNTSVGFSSLLSETVGDNNTAIGHYSLFYSNNGNYNTAIGSYSLYTNSSGGQNVALGYEALRNNTTSSHNAALGYRALKLSTGDHNLGVGYNSGSAIVTGNNNVVIGSNTGSTIDGLSNRIIISDGAANIRQLIDNLGKLQMPSYGSASPHTGTLAKTLAVDSSGYVIEVDATTGTVTSVALSVPTGLTVTNSPITTSGTITIGGTLGVANGGTGATTLTGILVGNGTSAISAVTDGTVGQVLSTNGSGTYSFIDAATGDVTVDGASVGNRVAVWNNTTGELRGTSAIATENSNIYLVQPSTNGTDKFNYIIGGAFAINENDFGIQNTGFGEGVFNGADFTGNSNTAFGSQSQYVITTGASNTSVGFHSMYDNRSGSSNVGLGARTMFNQRISNYNVAIGYDSMDGVTASQTAVSDYNTAVGYQSLQSIQGGDNNTVIGKDSGNAITTGSNNVIIGSNTGSTIATSSNNIIISDGSGNIRQSFDINGAATFSSSVTANQIFSTTTAAGYAATLTNTNGASDSNGLLVKAGSTASEYVVRFANKTDTSTFFTVKGTGAANFSSTSNGSVSLSSSASYNTSPSNLLFFNNYYNATDSTTMGWIQCGKENGNINNFDGYLSFATAVNNVGPTEKLRITSGGEIQVGGDAALIFGTNNTTDPYIQAASSGDELFFGRANGFQMAIRSDNVVDFKTGIRFINGGNDTLDAYEQDTYSPILKGSSTAGSSPTGVGTYTVIGNVCHLNIRFSGVTVTGAGGAIAISLPFAGKSINGQTTSNFNTYNVSFTGTNINALYVSGDVLYGLSSVSGTIWADWAIVDASNIYWNLSITYLIN